MADEKDHGEHYAHYDGEKESIINDSIGKEIGIRSDVGEESNNPFHVKELKNNPDTDRLKRLLE
ncbi:hypothetical protein [Aquibacillus kalidii]|uniref:hypothetical protein n=1 Tax=Aquibacillus kalidii TaxID=2762597 RepID=UPI00164786B3|nr:hypothetical protein [Aquibacillus kalidii]